VEKPSPANSSMFNPRLSASICGSLLLFPICLYLRYLRRSVCSPSASSVPLCFKGFVPDHRITRSRAITRFLTILAIFLLGEFFHRVRQGLSTRKTAQRTCPITRRIVNYPNYLFLPGVIYPHHTVGAPSFRAFCERVGEKYPQLSPLAPFA
jgi:hypothetical protein